MSAKCASTAGPMGILRSFAPTASQSFSAFDLVRCEVPKPGMVTAVTAERGSPNRSQAPAATSSARVESSPPERATTSPLMPVFSIRTARLLTCRENSSSSCSGRVMKGFCPRGRSSFLPPVRTGTEKAGSGRRKAGRVCPRRYPAMMSRSTSQTAAGGPLTAWAKASSRSHSKTAVWAVKSRGADESPSPPWERTQQTPMAALTSLIWRSTRSP